MKDKLKVKFLTVIWGAQYLEEFASVSLPSFLSDGNLPFVASETNLEIVIMTSAQSREVFDQLPIFAKLKALCPVKFIFIDDLITNGNYGVTLTLAYARGIRDSGPEQTTTHFVFMNADFVLADGSLRTLVAKLRGGSPCVMAASLRARSETALPALVEAVDRANHVLAMPPRQMARLAFDNLHPTVIAKTVTQDFVNCSTHNQLYWQVDQNTLVGRCHLIFMLAIKPEVPLGPINSYCDYGFVPELVPSGEFDVIDNTDGFFMLELQPTAREKEFLSCGRSTPDEIAAELGFWTTREHRRFAEVDIVFSSGEFSNRLGACRADAARYVADLHQRMPSPVNHASHFYWTSGLDAWKSHKFLGATPILPIELATEEADVVAKATTQVEESSSSVPQLTRNESLSVRFRGMAVGLARKLLATYFHLLGVLNRMRGVIPNVPIWSDLWLDSRLILTWVKSNKNRPRQRTLLICNDTSPLPISMRKRLTPDIRIELDDFLPSQVNQSGELILSEGLAEQLAEGFGTIFVHIYRSDIRKLSKILNSAQRYLKPEGMIAVFIEHKNYDQDSSNFSLELAQYIDELLPANWMGLQVTATFAGGLVKRRLRVAERFLFRFLWPTSLRRSWYVVFAAPLWLMVAALTSLHNVRLRKLSSTCPIYCSSALLCFKN